MNHETRPLTEQSHVGYSGVGDVGFSIAAGVGGGEEEEFTAIGIVADTERMCSRRSHTFLAYVPRVSRRLSLSLSRCDFPATASFSLLRSAPAIFSIDLLRRSSPVIVSGDLCSRRFFVRDFCCVQICFALKFCLHLIMEPSILLLCKYGSFTVVLTVTRDFRFDDLVQSICKKWQDLVLQRFQLLYAVSDHHNCHLDNDDDFANMFALAGAYGVSCVDVGVEVLSSSSVESRELERTFDVGESSFVHGVEEDPLEKFCPHHETVRLSSGWAKLISHVGQEFRGGVDDFRSCLAKFAIEVGFVYTFLKNDKTRHLKNNLRDKLTGRLSNGFREQVISLFSDCAYAPTLLDFEEAIQELYIVGGAKAKNFVESLPRENWANAYFQGKRYGEMCSNAAESFNKWILEARHLPILSAIDKIRIQLMTQRCDRRQKSTKMNGIVCFEMDARLVEAFSKGKVWTVAQSSEEVFEVFSLPTVVVDLQNQRCTCSRWQINSFPCMHAITAIQKFGKQVTNYLDPFYFVDAYRFSYELSINPIPTLGAPNVPKEFRIIFPPKTRRPRGRPKIQRIRSRGEKVRQMRCSRCKKLGKHNRKTCKEAVD
ncbi:hypothetical protein Vadar_005612 [Vaccinium darrowii]|uniref:Uncharacterized protein n=1 Tax=Vaccinium darrowii TaxID=229202 RepID=A0ACB7YSY1_9ERIC|nr:hypothetical protein Vadar_005612 [Vaccinium darrowii]